MPGPGKINVYSPSVYNNSRTSPDKEQFAVVYDILSEGPIEGLSNNLASIFLNDVPFVDPGINNIIKPRKIIINTTASSTTISHSQIGEIGNLSLNNKSGLSLGSRTITIEGAGGAGSSIASMTAGSYTVTTSSAFFTAAMANKNATMPVYIRIAGAGANGTDLVTQINNIASSTSATVTNHAITTVSSVDISADFNARITAISGNNATLSTAVPLTLSNAKAQISGLNTISGSTVDLTNFEKVEVNFRAGERNQEYIPHKDSFGSAAITTSLNINLEQADLRNVSAFSGLLANYNTILQEYSTAEGTAEDTVISAALAGVSNPSEIDEVHLTFKLPGSHALKPSSGAKGPSFVELQIFFEYSTDGGSSFTSEQIFGPTASQVLARGGSNGDNKVTHFVEGTPPNNGYIRPREPQYTEFSEEFIIRTQQYQPYDNWRVRVRRITAVNFTAGSFRHKNECILSTIESVVKDKLRYPYTSYISTSFNAADFDGQLPERAYLLKGLKIQVPTNYLTRDETGGAAAYTRNITTGATESTYQNWDGNFRGDVTTFNRTSNNYEKVYCDNPVWVFYDLLTNERYGLGQFVDKSNIDKYGLFQLAKYCDELVPDGEGGFEPRFTTNVYLSKAQEATNVLKQFASVFRGMALWQDGQVTAISDREKEPVYAFTKGNIENGLFTYEGTGNRVRTNQVKVQWNDPQDNYRQSIEYVEDQQGILETGRIVRSEMLAFGCTSRGQAHRAGKWKLLSERFEKETVSFVTSIAATGLKPGDIITVQDADRDRSSYSGRVSATGTKNTTTIPLDRTISLPSYSSDFPPQLLLVYPKGGAYLEQETATISSAVYNRGDLIPSITSQSDAANLTDDSNNSVQVFWSENVRIETKTVTTSAGNVSSLTVSSAFSEAPEEETIWSLRLFNSDGTEKTGAVKEYKIISIKEEEGYKYSIVAAAFASNKFAQIERGFELNPRPLAIAPNAEDEVPAPATVAMSVQPMSFANSTAASNEEAATADGTGGSELAVTWSFPQNSNGTRYKFVAGFEIQHNLSKELETIKVNPNDQSFTFKNIQTGTYQIKVRTVTNVGTVSPFTVRNIEVTQNSLGNSSISKVSLVSKGGVLNRALTINTDTVSIDNYGYQFDSPNGQTFVNINSNSDCYQQSFNGMGTSAEAYLLFDASESTDKLKAVQIHEDTSTTPTVSYFKTVGATNNGLTTGSGSVSIAFNDNAVIGSGTSFTSEFSNGGLVRLSNGSSTTSNASGNITDSTSLTIGASNSNIKIGHKVSGTGISTSVFVTAISGTSITLSSPQTINNGVTLTFSPVIYYGRIQFIESDTLMYVDEVVKTVYSGATIQYQTFKPSISQDAIIAKIITDASLDYSIDEIYAITAGLDGAAGGGVDARTVHLSASTFVIRYDNGSTPDDSTVVDITATPQGHAVTPTFDYYKSTDQWSSETQITTDNSGSTIAATQTTFTLADSDEPGLAEEVQIRCRMYEGGVLKATDFITIFSVQDGAGGIGGVTGNLTNSTHTVATDSNGTTTASGFYDEAGGVFEAFVGSTLVTTNSNVLFYTGTSGTNTTVTQNGLTLTLTQATGEYALSGSSWSTDSETFTIRALIPESVHGGTGTKTLTRKYTLSKSKAGVDGSAGAAVNLAFIRKATTPAVSGSGSLPSGETSPAWTDDVPTGTDPLWAVKGNKAQGGTTWSWGTPYRVDGTAVAEIYYYSDATTGSAPSFSAPTYNFSTNTYTAPTNWNKEPPSLTANNQKVYVIVVLYASTPGDTAAAADSVSSAVIYAQKTDGLNNATVYLYKTTNSATESTLPSGNATFTFSSGTLGSFATNANGWSQTITSVSASNEYLWTTSAVASSTTSTVVIPDSAWATPKLLSTFGESGLTGASVNIVFRRDSSTPSTPADSAGVPSGWSDSPPSGTDILFAVKGTKAVGGSNFTWGTVYQVEGTATAEVAIYRKNNNATPSGGSYNFTTSTLTAPSGWSTSVPSLTANGDIVYLAVGLFSGSPEETAATTTWSTPVVYAQRTDGNPGQDGDDGLKTVQGYLFYEKTTAGAPSAPSSSAVYRFSTNDIDGGSGDTEVLALTDTSAVNKWTNEPRTNNATSSNNFYSIRYSGTQTLTTDTTISVSYSSVVQQTSFTGVVTFSGGTLQDDLNNTITPIEADDLGSGGTTVIDGGRIRTGNIDAANVTISGGDVTINNSGITINGSSSSINLGSGAFTVSSAGVMTATGATISGNLTATSLNVTGATVTGTLDASTILLDGDPLDDLFAVSGTGSAKTLAIGPDTKNQLKVDGVQMTYKAYNNLQSTGDVAFEMNEDAAVFYNDGSGGDGRVAWTPTKIFPGDVESNTNSPGIVTPRVTINQSTVNDDYLLYAGGTSYISKLYIPNGLGVGTAASSTAGEIRATNNITAYYSDERLKDFKGKINNALEKVSKLNGYYFTENAKAKELGYNNDSLQVGVSAQEVEKVLPEIVTEAPIDSKYKTVWYDKLVPLLIEAIKELKAEIDELKDKQK